MATKKYDVFRAIADPTRRRILQLLVSSGALSLTAIAGDFNTSRQAVTKHITILEKAGLVSIENSGRERYCRAQFLPLKEVFAWVSFYEQYWDEKLHSLEDYLKNQSS